MDGTSNGYLPSRDGPGQPVLAPPQGRHLLSLIDTAAADFKGLANAVDDGVPVKSIRAIARRISTQIAAVERQTRASLIDREAVSLIRQARLKVYHLADPSKTAGTAADDRTQCALWIAREAIRTARSRFVEASSQCVLPAEEFRSPATEPDRPATGPDRPTAPCDRADDEAATAADRQTIGPVLRAITTQIAPGCHDVLNGDELKEVVGCSENSLSKQAGLWMALNGLVAAYERDSRQMRPGPTERDGWQAIQGTPRPTPPSITIIDACAGPGFLPRYPSFCGSSVIAGRILAAVRDPAILRRLVACENSDIVARCLERRHSLEFNGLPPFIHTILPGRFQDQIPRHLDAVRDRSGDFGRQYGCIHFDPNTINPADLSAIDTAYLTMCHDAGRNFDLLFHVEGTMYKRIGKAVRRDSFIDIGSLLRFLQYLGDKRYLFVSKPTPCFQWFHACITNYPLESATTWLHDAEHSPGWDYLDRVSFSADDRRKSTVITDKAGIRCRLLDPTDHVGRISGVTDREMERACLLLLGRSSTQS